LPSLIAWTATLVALSFWPAPRLPRGLPAMVVAFWTPRVTFLVLAALTLLFGFLARDDRQRVWTVIGGSVAVAVIYLIQLR
jgi:hypothetical protein